MRTKNLKRTLTGLVAGSALLAATVVPAGAQSVPDPSVPDVADASSVADVAASGGASIVGSAPADAIVTTIAAEGGQTARFTVAQSTDALVDVATETNKTIRDVAGN